MSTKRLVTKSQYARIRGCSPAYLSKPDVAARLAPAMETDSRGKQRVNVQLADEIFAKTTDTAKVRKPQEATALENPAAGGAASLDAIRIKQAQTKLEDQQLDLAARKGETVLREDVYRAAASAGHAIRTHLKMRNHRIAQRVATMTDSREIAVLLEESDREMPQQVSDEFMRKIQTD